MCPHCLSAMFNVNAPLFFLVYQKNTMLRCIIVMTQKWQHLMNYLSRIVINVHWKHLPSKLLFLYNSNFFTVQIMEIFFNSLRKTADVVPVDHDAECNVRSLPCKPNPPVKKSCQGNCF